MIKPRTLWMVVIHLVACVPAALHAQPQVSGSQPPEAVLNIVPMLKVSSGPGPARCGAGIVVGEASDRVYVVTARHLLRNDDGTPAPRIELFFRGLPGEPISGTELELGIDPTYDLTVLVVRNLPRDVVAGFQYTVLSDEVAPEITTNAVIRYIGHPRCNPWDHTRTPAPVKSWEPLLETEGSLASGYSGGGAFDSRWNLRGMAFVDDARTGMALPIRAIVSELVRNGIPVRLQRSVDAGPQASRLGPSSTTDNRL